MASESGFEVSRLEWDFLGTPDWRMLVVGDRLMEPETGLIFRVTSPPSVNHVDIKATNRLELEEKGVVFDLTKVKRLTLYYKGD